MTNINFKTVLMDALETYSGGSMQGLSGQLYLLKQLRVEDLADYIKELYSTYTFTTGGKDFYLDFKALDMVCEEGDKERLRITIDDLEGRIFIKLEDDIPLFNTVIKDTVDNLLPIGYEDFLNEIK